jgi:hypothetical protein
MSPVAFNGSPNGRTPGIEEQDMRTLHIASWAAVFVSVVLCAEADEWLTLPKGFPDPHGSSEAYGPHFLLTTAAYEKEAKRLLIEEATKVATELGLPEELPLAESNIVQSFIAPFGFAYTKGAVGNLTSHGYWYVSKVGWRLSEVTIANWSGVCASYARQYRWPSDRLNTNAAYNLATQWLAAVSMDVAGLNRDCDMHAAPDPHWNRFRWNTPFTNATFTPIYCVYWIPRQTTNQPSVAAEVKLFAPDKTLLSIRMEDPKYILRKPLHFTNVDELLAHPTSRWQKR